MTLRSIAWNEFRERPAAMIASLAAIGLSVAALVAIWHVTVFSEREVTRQLDQLGANVLVLPKGASPADYYSADLGGATLAEEHVDRILLAALTGAEKLSPRLCVKADVSGRPITLTGILPQSDLAAKTAWQTAALFRQPHAGCKRARCGFDCDTASPESLAAARTIERLESDQVVLGAEVAARESLQRGDTVRLLGAPFRVLAVMPASGNVDDGRVFAHLHRVQELAGSGPVVSAIEVMACCEDAAGGLLPKLGELLPDAKVVTIAQVVETQLGVQRLMAGASVFVLMVLVLVGGASVLSAISANVHQRRREIGTLVALGATPRFVVRLFLVKALWLGLAGGGLGGGLGILAAIWLGPAWAGIRVAPLMDVASLAAGAAVAVAIIAAWWPARSAARLDPCVCFHEV